MLLGRSNFDILAKETITSVVKMMENEAKSSKPFKQRKSFGKLCNRFSTWNRSLGCCLRLLRARRAVY